MLALDLLWLGILARDLYDTSARLVPIDLAWGIGLTALAGFAGKWVYDKVLGGSGR